MTCQKNGIANKKYIKDFESRLIPSNKQQIQLTKIMILKKNTIALTTLSFSAAIGLALVPVDSNAQRSGRGDDSRGSSSKPTPSVTNERSSSQFYFNDSNRSSSSNRYDNSNQYSSNQSSRGGSDHMAARLKKNVDMIDSLAGKMVWKARYDSIRNRSKVTEITYKAVTNHSGLTSELVKASHGDCPIALRKAALAVDSNLRLMIERRTNRFQGSNTCETVSDPILTLLNESKYPSSKVVQLVSNSSRGPGSYASTPTYRSVPSANVYNKPVAVREVNAGDVIFSLFRKHIR